MMRIPDTRRRGRSASHWAPDGPARRRANRLRGSGLLGGRRLGRRGGWLGPGRGRGGEAVADHPARQRLARDLAAPLERAQEAVENRAADARAANASSETLTPGRSPSPRRAAAGLAPRGARWSAERRGVVALRRAGAGDVAGGSAADALTGCAAVIPSSAADATSRRWYSRTAGSRSRARVRMSEWMRS